MDENVLAMYDVRGIQKYIFKTAKVKDAMGASALVENIISEALEEAVKSEASHMQTELKWYNDKGPVKYEERKDLAIEVLFIGGGNACVLYRSEELCLKINRFMSKYVLEQTYSLQLAVAYVKKTSDYAKDYQELYNKMNEIKANMLITKPLGALPIMKVEMKTGYPLCTEQGSTETLLKKKNKKSCLSEKEEKFFDKLALKKGIDSTLAIVHIDGNNMGLRIRELISGKETYSDAVNEIRNISYQIGSQYQSVFEEMNKFFTQKPKKMEKFSGKEFEPFIRKIVIAGDDITYVCNAQIALATVEYYCRKISMCTLNGQTDKVSIRKYGFSVCAGIAYIGAHFPFSIGYDVAERCCENAKERAKNPENLDGMRIGNFVDFQICKNVQVRNLDGIRQRDYQTYSGEQLLTRPYFIPGKDDKGFKKLEDKPYHFKHFKKEILYFQDDEKLPRSFAKKIRNTYPQGAFQMQILTQFLNSRGWKMPDGEMKMYDHNKRAKWYDVLEMMDCYVDIEEFCMAGMIE